MELRYQNLVEMMERCCAEYADRPMFGTKENETYQWVSFKEFGETVTDLRGALTSLGVGEGDSVGVIADNMIPWVTMAYATYSVGGIYVPMYTKQQVDEWKYILRDANCKILLVATESLYRAAESWKSDLPDLEQVILLTEPKSDEPLLTYAQLLKNGKEHPWVAPVYPEPDKLMGMIYTSGTTGMPKGVQMSHRTVLLTLQAGLEAIPANADDRTLAFLPWAHIFGQICEVHALIWEGFSAAMLQNLGKLVDELGEVRPTMLFAVPRVYNRIHEKLHLQIYSKSPTLYALFEKGLVCSSKRRRGERLLPHEWLIFKICDKLFFSKVRAKFGGRLRFAYSGGSALNAEVIEFMQNMGINLMEGYGLSEVIAAVNRPERQKIGAVGQVLSDVRIEIDQSVSSGDSRDGEIVIYGPLVTPGYHNLPEENAKSFTSDGGFRTGDVGHFDEEGYLHITGRVKEIYKLENGKYIAPALLEEAIKLSPFVNQVMIYGFQKVYNVALVVVELEAIQSYAERNDMQGEVSDWLRSEEIQDLMKKEIRKHTKDFQDYERPKRFHLLTEEWTVENNLITPTLKLKRNLVEQRFQKELEAMY